MIQLNDNMLAEYLGWEGVNLGLTKHSCFSTRDFKCDQKLLSGGESCPRAAAGKEGHLFHCLRSL